ncbi:MAG: hypothetical protein AAGG55_03440 [Pseudomonadota bacterium]
MPDHLVLSEVPTNADHAKAMLERIESGDITAADEALELLEKVIDGSYSAPKEKEPFHFEPTYSPHIQKEICSLSANSIAEALEGFLTDHCGTPVTVTVNAMSLSDLKFWKGNIRLDLDIQSERLPIGEGKGDDELQI